MFPQELTVFFLKGTPTVMFLLVLHVFYCGVELGRTDRKSSVAPLPIEFAYSGATSLIHLEDVFFKRSIISASERVLGRVTIRWI